MTKKPDETQTIIRLPQSLLEDIKRFAELHERSINGELVWALRQYVEQQKKEEVMQALEARKATFAEDVRTLGEWRDEVEKGVKLYHATHPLEMAGKNPQGEYVRTYDDLTQIKHFEDWKEPVFAETFDELVAKCDPTELWSNELTSEVFVNLSTNMCDRLQATIGEPVEVVDEENEAEDFERYISQEHVDLLRKTLEEKVFPAMRQKGYKKWSEDSKKKDEE